MAESYDRPAPPRPARRTLEIDESPREISIVHRKRQWGVAAFLAFWLTFWTIGCVVLAAQLTQEPTLGHFAFALPFWAAELFVAGFLLTLLFKREELTLNSQGIRYRKSVLGTIQRRTIPLDEILRFESSYTTNYKENGRPHKYVEVITAGHPLPSLEGLDEQTNEWLTWRLNNELRALRPEGPVSKLEHLKRDANRDQPARPSDAEWIDDVTFDGTSFTQRGRWKWGTIGVMLFISAFWNGIVSVFVLAQLGVMPGNQGKAAGGFERVGLGLFLIPFELIGLVLLTILAFALLEPVRRTRWSFTRNAVTYSIHWFGIGYSKRYDLPAGAKTRLLIAGLDTSLRGAFENTGMNTTSTRRIYLQILSPHQAVLASMSGITEGEGRWIQWLLRRYFPE